MKGGVVNPRRLMRGGKVASATRAASLVSRLKRDGKIVVFTNGCFDLLHVGHLTVLEKARALGVLSPFVPGGHWRFASWTEPFWSGLEAETTETSVYVGWSLLALTIYTWRRRRRLEGTPLGVWFFIMLSFGLLALGTHLRFAGRSIQCAMYSWSLV